MQSQVRPVVTPRQMSVPDRIAATDVSSLNISMSLVESVKTILEGKSNVVTGTNCGNCKFFTGPKVDVDSLKCNPQGGINAPDSEHLKLAKENDLITLPGGSDKPTNARACAHKKIDQVVTDRMCCALWDNPGALREFK